MGVVGLVLFCLGLSGCFGQQYLSVEVVPLNTTSVQATFIPPSPETYTLHYMFGNGAPMSEEITVSSTDPQTRVLTDATADPGTLVRVQVNSTQNFIYPTTQVRTCTAAPDPPGGISAFIDSTGFMHTTWTGASSESGVTQYNMEYRVMNRMDSNQITVPARMTEANVSSLRIQVLYEVRLQSCLVSTCAVPQGPWSSWTNALATPNFGPLCNTSPGVGAASFATVLLMLVCALAIRLVA